MTSDHKFFSVAVVLYVFVWIMCTLLFSSDAPIIDILFSIGAAAYVIWDWHQPKNL